MNVQAHLFTSPTAREVVIFLPVVFQMKGGENHLHKLGRGRWEDLWRQRFGADSTGPDPLPCKTPGHGVTV